MVEIIADDRPVARKAHICCMCSRTIDPGETYRRARAVGDDGPYVFKECMHCRLLIKLHGDEFVWDWYEGYCDEDVREWEPATVATMRLKVQFRRRWRRRDGALYPLPADVVTSPGADPRGAAE